MLMKLRKNKKVLLGSSRGDQTCHQIRQTDDQHRRWALPRSAHLGVEFNNPVTINRGNQLVDTFQRMLGLKGDETAFPWQIALLARLQSGIEHRLTLDVPTGLGKTSVMTAWLMAKALGAELPRRLICVVDRRAVVDQATREAERLRDWVEANPDVLDSLGLAGKPLPISTLRGQFADNRHWLSDPTLPSIVVGTVDMVGSRLLFEGYGVSRKMRPYHAGLLGVDTLFALDEAHLVPPFEAILERVVAPETSLRRSSHSEKLLPRSVLVSLSATGRAASGDIVQINEEDLNHIEAGKRLRAEKRLRLIEPDGDNDDLVDRLAEEAWTLSGLPESDQISAHRRIIVFCNSRQTAMKVEQAVVELAKAHKLKGTSERKIETQLFVGARRVRERQEVEDWLEEHGFLAGSKPSIDLPAFVFATSAGEVGVDLDADHMVGDLVAFERMIQRFGRVNRRGRGAAEIRVLMQRDVPNKQEAAALKKALAKAERQRGAKDHEVVRAFDLAPKYRAALESLPVHDNSKSHDASPEAFRQLKIFAQANKSIADILTAATTPAPLRPELTRPILDSWSMTSLEKHSARPLVAPWLRGWVDDEPQTTVVWRMYLPTMSPQCTDKQIEEFFEAAPIHLTEKLETTSQDAFNWLLKRGDRIAKLKANPKKSTTHEQLDALPAEHDVVAILLNQKGDAVCKLTLWQLKFAGGKSVQNDKETFRRQLANCTLVVDARLGGLSRGLLDDKADETQSAEAADSVPTGEWIDTENKTPQDDVDPIPSFQILERSAEELREQPGLVHADPLWKSCYQLPIQMPNEDEPSRFLIVRKYRTAVTSEESRSTIGLRSLEAHLQDTETEVQRLTKRLELPAGLTLAMRIAARNHDHGKNCDRWQNAFSAPEDGRPYAKTPGPFRNSLLDGYRHEFGSLPLVATDPEFAGLDEDMQDLTLHLVASHHGFARPVIRTVGAEDAPPSALVERAREVALRFARVQQAWGPWGLAWLESILRAADQRASALVDDTDAKTTQTQQEVPEIAHG